MLQWRRVSIRVYTTEEYVIGEVWCTTYPSVSNTVQEQLHYRIETGDETKQEVYLQCLEAARSITDRAF